MSLTQDEKNEIRRENPTYPRVSRTTDPMVVRIDKTSLLVNDTMFTAKLKCGLGYKGYLIYSSGLGTPIYEKAAKTTGEWQKSFSTVGNRPYNIAFDSENTSQLTNVLTAAAKEWLDDLEIAIADRENDNAIKKAIDRLCWQLHYDITQSSTDFPEVFKDNDFGDVEIDWQENDTWNGKTVNESVFNNYTAISTSVTDGSSTISGGSSLQGVKSSISSFDGNLCGKFETFNGKFDTFNNNFTTFDTHLNGSTDSTRLDIKNSLDTIGTKLVPDDTATKGYYSISECLRDKDDYNDDDKKTFSIARSLREGKSQTSVSQATHDQTELEEDKFNEISETKLGDFGSTGKRTLAQVLDGYVESTNQSLSGAVGYTYRNDSPNAAQKSVESMIGYDEHDDNRSIMYTIFHNPGVMKTDYINAYSPPQGSMMGSVNTIYNNVNTVYNNDDRFMKVFFGDGTVSGVWGGVHSNKNWVRAMTPSDGSVWNV